MTPVASTADVTSVSSPHPEEFCQLCGGPNLLCWFVESPLWNKYVREPGHPEILCPRCFAKLAEDAGYNPTAWQLVPENPPAASLAAEDVELPSAPGVWFSADNRGQLAAEEKS